ncbi:hypothetical protein BDB00DRAFT_840145 [Zychaea mexicana]|uniref:uncharacterized protein n=1 Tax=Zychaea mexicana TaxID=64656 RepID=UPI0022FE1C08|nr:uncharacterized protein BDB00DRAFT_840145 [Zychaea mexicana]KAI9489941.1 hypothetical protein BDB00DRAFT_840145 [Zychaea mexicana]
MGAKVQTPDCIHTGLKSRRVLQQHAVLFLAGRRRKSSRFWGFKQAGTSSSSLTLYICVCVCVCIHIQRGFYVISYSCGLCIPICSFTLHLHRKKVESIYLGKVKKETKASRSALLIYKINQQQNDLQRIAPPPPPPLSANTRSRTEWCYSKLC